MDIKRDKYLNDLINRMTQWNDKSCNWYQKDVESLICYLIF